MAQQVIRDPRELEDDKARIKAGFRLKYGAWWRPVGKTPLSDLLIEFLLFSGEAKARQSPGKYEHAKNIINAIWNNPNSPEKFVFHPWAERMLKACCKHQFLAIAGCASSGKSRVGAIWAIIQFLASPNRTKVLVTSTDLKASRERVWGDIEKYWRAACVTLGGEAAMPGVLVSSAGMIKRRTDTEKDATRGISLVAGDKSQAAESISKMQGVKAENVVLIADELAELSDAIRKTAESNLAANENFQMVAMANPNSFYDPFGIMAEPENGWASINETMAGWKTKRGYCIRFDGEKSPNILAGRTVYPWMITEEKLAEYKRTLGEKSLRYYRMVKGYWCPSGATDGIFNEADIVRYKGDQKAVWREPPVNVAGFDPAYTNFGDRSVLQFAKYGITTDGLKTIELGRCIEINEDVSNKSVGRNYQIANKLIAECKKAGVHPRHLAIDGTGAGKPFCDIVRNLWNGEFLEINFSGAPSDLPASGTDDTPSKERYVNHVSEIWFVGREYLQSGQLRGISSSLSKEWCSRTYETRERGKVRVEPKTDMKGRVGFSPDEGDAAALVVAVCRHRLGLASKMRSGKVDSRHEPRSIWTDPAVNRSKFKAFAQKMSRMLH